MKLDRDFEIQVVVAEYLGGDFVKLLEAGRVKIRDGKMVEGLRNYEVILKMSGHYGSDGYTINRVFGAYISLNEEGKITSVDVKGNNFGYEYREEESPKQSALPSPDEIKQSVLGCYWSDVVGFTSFNYDDGFNHLNEVRTMQVRIPVTTSKAYHGWIGLDSDDVAVSVQLTSIGSY